MQRTVSGRIPDRLWSPTAADPRLQFVLRHEHYWPAVCAEGKRPTYPDMATRLDAWMKSQAVREQVAAMLAIKPHEVTEQQVSAAMCDSAYALLSGEASSSPLLLSVFHSSSASSSSSSSSLPAPDELNEKDAFVLLLTALFLCEPARNPATWPVSWMLLDLLAAKARSGVDYLAADQQVGYPALTWPSLLWCRSRSSAWAEERDDEGLRVPRGLHPMSMGSSFTQMERGKAALERYIASKQGPAHQHTLAAWQKAFSMHEPIFLDPARIHRNFSQLDLQRQQLMPIRAAELDVMRAWIKYQLDDANSYFSQHADKMLPQTAIKATDMNPQERWEKTMQQLIDQRMRPGRM